MPNAMLFLLCSIVGGVSSGLVAALVLIRYDKKRHVTTFQVHPVSPEGTIPAAKKVLDKGPSAVKLDPSMFTPKNDLKGF